MTSCKTPEVGSVLHCHLCTSELEHFVEAGGLTWCTDGPLCKFRARARLRVSKLRSLELLREDRAQERRLYRKVIWSSPWKIFAAEQRNLAAACERCGKSRALQVHHLHYGTLGHERPEDVVCVCRPCHVRLDQLRRKGTVPHVEITVGEAKRVVTWGQR